MLNYRRIDNKFSLSGGWYDLYRNLEFLEDEKVVAILDLQFIDWDPDSAINQVARACENFGIDYEAIRFDDGINENKAHTRELIEQGTDVIERFVETYPKKNQRILVKCAAGISRSATMYISYLCRANRWTFDEAYSWVQKQESDEPMEWGASPNYFFRQILREMYGGEIESNFPRLQELTYEWW